MKSRLKDRRKDIARLLAALHLRDAYAMRKLVRRIVPVLVLTSLVMTASPSWAKKITDDELAAFLGRPVTKSTAATAPAKAEAPAPKAPEKVVVAEKAAVEVPAAAVAPAVSEASASGALSSKEGELKTGKPKEVLSKKKTKPTDIPEADPLELKAEGQTLTVQGEVSGRSNYGLAVNYEADALKGEYKEMWLNLLTGTKVAGVKDLSELEEGDRVSVTFKQVAGSNKKLLQKVALLQRKPPEPVVVEAVQ